MRILDEVRGCRTIGIAGHIRPDGDAIGSCMGLALFLEKMMPDARIDVFGGHFDDALMRNIPGTEQINFTYQTDVESYDCFIALDCEKERLDQAEAFFDAAKKTINIDHHESHKGSGDVNFIEPYASSTCELVYLVIDREQMDEKIAQALYVGMITDSGIFRFSNTSKRTMEIAGDLMSFGIPFSAICRDVYFAKTYRQQQLMGRALVESIRLMDGKVIVSVFTRKIMDFYEATSYDLDGISSQLVLTEGVDVAIFMHEVEPMTFKVSMRSKGAVNVAKVCQKFGGGGHAQAAGCTVNQEWRDIVNNMTQEIERIMEPQQ